MKKIIFIDHENFTIRRRELFVVDELIAAGFEVEYWEVSKLLVDMAICDTVSAEYLHKISSIKEFELRVKNQDIRNTFFVVEFIYNWRSRRLIKVLEQNNCTRVKIELYSTIFPPMRQKPSMVKQLISTPILKLPKKVLGFFQRNLFKLYCRKNNLTLNYSYYLTSDSNYLGKVDALVNHPDWMKIKEAEAMPQSEYIPSTPYLVFIDQYYPLHPDFKWLDVGSLGSAELYQRELNRFFDLIGRDLGYEVIVAAHPKADYSEGTFEGRRIMKYRTPELIKYSSGVMMHTSLAASYALYFEKPIMLITNKEHSKSDLLKRYQGVYKSILELPIICTDELSELKQDILNPVDLSIKESLIYSVMTCKGNELKDNGEILTEFFQDCESMS